MAENSVKRPENRIWTYHGSVGCKSTDLTLSDRWANFRWSPATKQNKTKLKSGQKQSGTNSRRTTWGPRSSEVVGQAHAPWSPTWAAARDTSRKQHWSDLRANVVNRAREKPANGLEIRERAGSDPRTMVAAAARTAPGGAARLR